MAMVSDLKGACCYWLMIYAALVGDQQYASTIGAGGLKVLACRDIEED